MQSLLTHFANTLVSSKTLLLSMIIYISLSFFLPPIHTRISLASPASTPAKQPSPQKMAIAEIISGYRSLSPHFILTVGNSPHTHTIRYYYYFSSINVKIEIQSYHIQGPKAMSGLKRRWMLLAKDRVWVPRHYTQVNNVRPSSEVSSIVCTPCCLAFWASWKNYPSASASQRSHTVPLL